MMPTRAFGRSLWAMGFAVATLGAPRAGAAVGASAQPTTTASPSDPAKSLDVGRALRRAGHLDDATRELKRGVSLGKKTSEVTSRLQLEIARTAIDRRDFKLAMATCRSISRAPLAHACAAETYLLWRRASESLLESEQALKGDAQNYEAKVAEGIAKGFQNRPADAEVALREAIAWRPNSIEAYLALGRVFLQDGRSDAAIGEFRRALALEPNAPEAAYELGRAIGVGPEAVELFERAIREREAYLDALVGLAVSASAAGDGSVAKGRMAAEQALKIDPKDANVHVALARVALAESKADEALAQGEAALAILANSSPAKLVVADAYAKKHEIDLAIEAYQAAYGLDHSDPASLVHASEACHREGRDTSAKAFALKATKEFPSWAPGWAALGDALASRKETDDARSAYQAALKGKGLPDQASVRRRLESLK